MGGGAREVLPRDLRSPAAEPQAGKAGGVSGPGGGGGWGRAWLWGAGRGKGPEVRSGQGAGTRGWQSV